ncbi:UDP-N-acetylmuramoyl-L-alanyl-D-glutamate--2,6-diaminopimelate ligase [Xylanimonas ulmi]|uniref:UDP-N-acetylmuramyl-tripeptide synthetase n=1 Tax=Xylanimonas ulmi TaxID=228973 RepID=A0A4Q7M0L2_9MICO|nr:UDP-N-acetylmuramoyl-L-alanyl-D-glutamate--2,6-diaminopimelate ligase [Xylanibacterium ulmi]RZS61295.1 UDP-N-acetylmuramoylalanyl-D-glutamate--2,6-diaminopimelate ligase [Xylanibacterium ulmi]
MTSPLERIRPADNAPRRVRDLAHTFDLRIAAGPAPDGEGPTVTSVASDNRVVEDGDLFVALPGARAHGAAFAADAVARGARAVLTDAAGADLVGGLGVPVLVAADPRLIIGHVAAWVYGSPAEHLTTFAVTGTNGKTTTAYQIDHLLRALGFTSGLVGTVEMRSGDRVLPSRLTTPEAADLQALLAAMREDGVRTLAMEVSSHALALHRVDGVRYGVAGFTNLSQDHLDFHGDLQSYFAAKALLFTPEHARRGVVVVDDAWGERMAEVATIPVATLRTTPTRDGGPAADWVVTDVAPHGTGSAFTVTHTDGRTLRTSTTLPGGFNVANAALALVMVLEGGAHLEDVADALDAAGGLAAVVPGRMEVVSAGGDGRPRVVVDFAHNTEALELALGALRATTPGRLTVVFGATGDRDTGKRPAMGAAAVAGADVVVVTDDDPHGEDPAAVRAQVLAGARAAAAAAAHAGGQARVVEVREVAPRADAIRTVVAHAGAQDTVLVAGRGHETVQDVAGVDVQLDDRVEARAALAARPGITTEGTTTA